MKFFDRSYMRTETFFGRIEGVNAMNLFNLTWDLEIKEAIYFYLSCFTIDRTIKTDN